MESPWTLSIFDTKFVLKTTHDLEQNILILQCKNESEPDLERNNPSTFPRAFWGYSKLHIADTKISVTTL